ncbi:COQ9 family protein [Rhodovulum sp. DZ06]|uniref:COQ9 family protein n=1 Tax=Rhodovulum sp. DZ06 TaxID=3425126 RepID=UPI003D34F16A
MTDADRTPSEAERIEAFRDRLLDAMLMHVPFDGWSKAAMDMAMSDLAARGEAPDPGLAKLAFPRGGIDAALAFHRRGDRQMEAAYAAADTDAMKIRDRVTFAVRTRLEIAEKHREAVRRGATLLALPIHAAEGAKAVWGTADAIWKALGDTSQDLNWYSKRATLSGVYSAVALYWLQDESEGRAETWAFLDRRIDNVMQIEKGKAAFRKSPLGKIFGGPLARASEAVKAPGAARPGRRFGFPGPRG